MIFDFVIRGVMDKTEKIDTSYVDISNLEIPDVIIHLIPADFAIAHRCLPIRKKGKVLDVIVPDPSDIYLLSDIRFITGCEIEPYTTSEKILGETIARHYGRGADLSTIMEDITKAKDVELVEADRDEAVASELLAQAEEAPVVRYVNTLIREGIVRSASDIHIEPYDKFLRTRIRIDGKLNELPSPPWKLHRAIISRVKVMANLDLAERRIPQDGRILVKYQGRRVDLRVSTTPTIYGEKVVVRILDKAATPLEIENLGMDGTALKRFIETIKLPYGLLLVTGPTGSGKTTTLYSALNSINRPDINIMTAEDPVEFDFVGVNQVAIREKIGLRFTNILRAFLRQDPDVIMVGEIRDKETADIAIRASLTGHLVLSTLHTNDAPSAITRLEDMDVEPYLIASSLELVVAQRLIRRICEKCKEKVEISKDALKGTGLDPSTFDKTTFYKGKGCSYCNNTGYKGREGIFEVLSVSPTIREMVIDNKPLDIIRDTAKKEGMLTLGESAIEKLKMGVTTIDEVIQLIRGQK